MHILSPATPPPDITGRLAFLIAALLRACGPHIVKDRTAGPWLLTVWHRMNAISQRIQRLAAQIQAGTVPPLRAGFKLTKPRKPPTKPSIVLPSHPWWLVQVIQPTAVYGVWLQQILADSEMAAMLAAAPQLARILRPLCRALGVTPPPLPPRPPRPDRPDSPDPAPPSPAPLASLGCDADQGRGEARAAGSGPAAPPTPHRLQRLERAPGHRSPAQPHPPLNPPGPAPKTA